MHFPFRFLVLVAILGLGGCASVRNDFKTNVREKFSEPNYRTRIYEADSRPTYEAARAALDAMEFRFLRGGPAQRRLEAVNRVSTNESFKGSQQIKLQARLSEAAGGGTELAVYLTEIIQENYSKGSGLGTETPLRDTPLYEVFFRNVEQALVAAGASRK